MAKCSIIGLTCLTIVSVVALFLGLCSRNVVHDTPDKFSAVSPPLPPVTVHSHSLEQLPDTAHSFTSVIGGNATGPNQELQRKTLPGVTPDTTDEVERAGSGPSLRDDFTEAEIINLLHQAKDGEKGSILFALAITVTGQDVVRTVSNDRTQTDQVRLKAAAALAQRGDVSGVAFAKEILDTATTDARTLYEASEVLYYAYNVKTLLDYHHEKVNAREEVLREIRGRIACKLPYEYHKNFDGLMSLYRAETDANLKSLMGDMFWNVATLTELIAAHAAEGAPDVRECLMKAIRFRASIITGGTEELEQALKVVQYDDVRSILTLRIQELTTRQ